MFVLMTFSIFLAHFPNRNVDKEISKSNKEGDMLSTSNVREFPPKLDRRIFVKGEFRNGMCFAFLPYD
jgi:hypothetical protein